MPGTFHFGGIPVEPEVRKLREQIAVARDGRLIPHAQIEEILQLRRDQSRYRTIIAKWRKELLNGPENVYLDGRQSKGEGFICCDGAAMLRESVKSFRSGSRRISLGAQLVSQTPSEELTTIERHKKEHLGVVLNWVRESLHNARAMIGRPRRQEPLPYRTPPQPPLPR